MTFRVTQKSILITGGTSGIGHELVRQLHSDNTLLVIGRNAEKLRDLKAEFPGVHTYVADLADPQSLRPVAETIRSQHPQIDLLINNAAIQYTALFTGSDFRYESIAEEIAINFTSPCCLISLFLPALLKDTPSAILNINSGLGLVAKKSSAIYCGTKGGLNIFSGALRHQLANTNIKVFQAFMPLVDTPMTMGRGHGKMTANKAANLIITGVEKGRLDHDIGMVRILRFLCRLWPAAARNIMKRD